MRKFNNPKVNLSFEIAQDHNWQSDIDKCMGAIAAYCMGIFDVAKRKNLDLDLTYETARNLKMITETLWNHCGEEIDDRRKTYCKMLASYLVLLAVNEHDCNLVLWLAINEEQENESEDELLPIIPVNLWCGSYVLGLSSKELAKTDMSKPEKEEKTVDLLDACVKAIYSTSKYLEQGCIVELDEIVEKYENLTGVNLSEYGLSGRLMLDVPAAE